MRVLDWSPRPHFPPYEDTKPGLYNCGSCGHSFAVDDVRAYATAHPPAADRCPACDQKRLVLVARDINPSSDPNSPARADAFECAACGAKVHVSTVCDPSVLY